MICPLSLNHVKVGSTFELAKLLFTQINISLPGVNSSDRLYVFSSLIAGVGTNVQVSIVGVGDTVLKKGIKK